MADKSAKLGKWGNSYGVRIPKKILDLAKIDDCSKLTIKLNNNNNIEIINENPKSDLMRMFDGFDYETAKEENKALRATLDGQSIGNELI